MHWYIPLEFNIVESVSWLLLLSNTHVERPPIPTGFIFPPFQEDVLLLTPTPVLVIQVDQKWHGATFEKETLSYLHCNFVQNIPWYIYSYTCYFQFYCMLLRSYREVYCKHPLL